jgi:hypothetical protein
MAAISRAGAKVSPTIEAIVLGKNGITIKQPLNTDVTSLVQGAGDVEVIESHLATGTNEDNEH